MKDLTGKQPFFINNYTVEDDKILLHLSNNTVMSCPYSRDFELNVLKKLRLQAENLVKYKKHVNLEEIGSLAILGASTSAGLYMGTLINGANTKTIPIIGCALYFVIAGLSAYNAFNDIIRLDELNKYKYYLKNEEIISNPHDETKISITLNDIDDYSVDDLKEIVKIRKQEKDA